MQSPDNRPVPLPDKVLQTFKCQYCQTINVTYRKDKKFCNDVCRVKHWNKEHPRIKKE